MLVALADEEVYDSVSFRVNTPDGTVTVIISENRRPIHIQIFLGKAGSPAQSWAIALSNLINLAFKNDVPIAYIIANLSNLSNDRITRLSNGVTIHNGPTAVAYALHRYNHYIQDKGIYVGDGGFGALSK